MTDFDGTLRPRHGGAIPEVVGELAATLRARRALWAIASSRDATSLRHELDASPWLPLPDALIAEEDEIFLSDGTELWSWAEWNERARSIRLRAFAQCADSIERFRLTLDTGGRDLLITSSEHSPLSIVAPTPRIISELEAAWITLEPAQQPLRFARNDCYGHLAAAALDKGAAVAALARRLGVSRANLIVAGDDVNDLPMFVRARAANRVAPGDAVPTVIKAVRGAGGYVSAAHHAFGTFDGVTHALDSMPGVLPANDAGVPTSDRISEGRSRSAATAELEGSFAEFARLRVDRRRRGRWLP